MEDIEKLIARREQQIKAHTPKGTHTDLALRQNFERLSRYEQYDKKTERFFNLFVSFLEDMKAGTVKPYTLMTTGNNGVGKSMLAKAVYDYFRVDKSLHYDPVNRPNSPHKSSCFAYWPEIAKQARKKEMREFNRAAKAFFTVIDDLGAGDKTGFEGEIDRETMNMMVNARLGKWTIYTSNLTADQFDLIDRRILSRFRREGGER